MRRRMRREDWRVVAVLGFLHGTVHANILSIPVFLLAWQPEFRADNLTLGLLAASAYIPYASGRSRSASLPTGARPDGCFLCGPFGSPGRLPPALGVPACPSSPRASGQV